MRTFNIVLRSAAPLIALAAGPRAG